MFILRYGSKPKLTILLILTVVLSTKFVFLAYILAKFILAATEANMNIFTGNVYLAIIGFSAYGGLGIIEVRVKSDLIKSINIRVKQIMTHDLLNTSIQENEIAKELSFMTNDLKLLETNRICEELALIENVLTFSFSLIAAFLYDILSTLAFIVGSLAPIFISNFTQGGIRAASETWSQTNSGYTSKLKDLLSGMRSIRTYQAEKQIDAKVGMLADEMEASLAQMNNKVGIANSLAFTFAMLGTLTLPFGVGIYRVIHGLLPLASFMAVVNLSNSLTNPIMAIIEAKNQIHTTDAIAAKITAAEKRRDAEGRAGTLAVQSFSQLQLIDAEVVLQDKTIIKNLNLIIHANEKILIMAPSGFGKSTLLRVLQNEQGLTSGTYRYNDRDISAYDPLALKQQFSLIQQTPFVFDDTIRFNITLGDPFADAEINEAIGKAGLTELVANKGDDYQVGENGKNLSGGELQRIEIARAFIRNRPILLADEATSALDHETSEKIRDAFVRGSNTLIEVAHNISDADKGQYDRIIQMNDLVRCR